MSEFNLFWSNSLNVKSVLLSMTYYGPFFIVCNFYETHLCFVKFGFSTSNPFFKAEAGVKRKSI